MLSRLPKINRMFSFVLYLEEEIADKLMEELKISEQRMTWRYGRRRLKVLTIVKSALSPFIHCEEKDALLSRIASLLTYRNLCVFLDFCVF